MTLFDDIIEAIVAEFHITEQSIKKNGGQKGLRGRKILCFIVEHDYKRYRNELAEYLAIAPIGIVLMSRSLIEKLNDGGRFLASVNRVRKKLRLPVFKPSLYAKKMNKGIVHPRRKKTDNSLIFNIKYSKQEELAIRRAKEKSVIFFEKYGKGRKPKFVSDI